MNKENFQRVLDIVNFAIKSHDPDDDDNWNIFRMSNWFNMTSEHKKGIVQDLVKHPCGTVGCIAGWGVVFQIYDQNPTAPAISVYEADYIGDGARFFDITESDAEFLFDGRWHPRGVYVKNVDVAKKLQRIIETGVVRDTDWDTDTFWE